MNNDTIAQTVNNWGRWGTEDQLGCLNLINQAAVQRGLAAAKHGETLSLALPLDADGPQIGLTPGRTNPKLTVTVSHQLFTPTQGLAFNDDRVDMSLQAATHWDALAHCEYNGRCYNNHDAQQAPTEGCTIGNIGAIQSRGVLLDVAAAMGVERLPDSHGITNEDLDRALERSDVILQPGDILLIRTGQMQYFLNGQREHYSVPCPGLTPENALWFHRHNVAAVATDNYAFDVVPYTDGESPALHRLCLVEMGLMQGQNWNLETLSKRCKKLQQYSFLLTASPEPFTGAYGAPVVPVVTL
ncbi:kynurenine formamidase [Sinobacterium caligoides]|uniref:Kynurenine formamidase n=1 Tax=Sinobacterium caligoides TaxID=933926 RepID=A0A3N2DKD7_9GAMM|nr:cyclase family protein [Sinobacterium caligoides]ROS00264.1 kynurenine formamidase [Sinobacterium caligoides]